MNTYDFKYRNVNPIFEKYIIDNSYNIKRMRDDGTEEAISDDEKDQILNQDPTFFAGSLAISRDTNHVGALHKIFCVTQKIHRFFSGRCGDDNLCHGMIYLEKGNPPEVHPSKHPYVIAHAVFDGIHTSLDDYPSEEDVTEVVIYRPRDPVLRNIIIKNVKHTAFIKKEELRTDDSPKSMSPFSILNMFLGLFRNGKHEVCGKDGSKPSPKMMEKAADLITDMLLGNQILDHNGDPKAMYCAPYALAVVQGSFVQDLLNKKIPEKDLKAFLNSSDHTLLTRKELSSKILKCLQYDNKKCPISHELWQLYWGNKLLRLNFDNVFSCYLSKNLDKYSKPPKEIKTSYNIVNYETPKESTWLERTVRWYKEKLCLPPLVKKIISFIAAGILFVLSCGFVLPLIYKIHSLSYKIDLENVSNNFKANMAEKLRLNPDLRPKLGKIELKSDVSCFNHVSEYTLHAGVIWFRRRDAADAQWQPMFFDGDLTGTKPVSLSADGANLVVIDDRGGVHYRKVLSEGRGYENINRKEVLKRHLRLHQDIEIDKKDQESYFAVDISEKANWKPSWYNFPVLKHFVNAISSPELYSKGRISHRGQYVGGYSDPVGNFHRCLEGVTTLYDMDASGTFIRKFDPWAPNWSKVMIAFPKNETTSFIGRKCDSSASTLMALGYKINKDTRRGRLTVITNLADIDTMGNNPGLKYAYEIEKNTEYKTRILPDAVENEGWVEHCLPEDVQEVYGQPTIIQTGKGNEARELRVGVTRGDGQIGYYKKANLGPHAIWEFVPYKDVDKKDVLTVDTTLNEQEFLQVPFTKVYKGNCESAMLELVEFDEDKNHAKLRVYLNNKTYTLYLHKRLGLGTFLGIKHEKYTLVLPEEQEDAQILAFLGHHKKIDVDLNRGENGSKRKDLQIYSSAAKINMKFIQE